MSSFTSPACLEMLDNYKWRLLSPFKYHIGSYPSEEVVLVPAGFVTDLATIPRVFWWILPPHGRWAKAAIIHDYLYENAIGTKKKADSIFLECMQVLDVPVFIRYIMFFGARIFGRGKFNKMEEV